MKYEGTLTSMIEQQRKMLENLQNKYDILEKSNEENRSLISTQRQELDTMKEILAGSVDENNETAKSAAKNPNATREDQKLQQTGTCSQKQLEDTVAFHATFAEDRNLSGLKVGATIPFTTVKFNKGGGYHPSTSLFISPRGGLYIFSTTVMSHWRGKRTLHVGIMKNAEYLAGAYAEDDGYSAEQGSVTVATQLKVGDEVWVRHQVHDNASVYGAGLTSFMGCLVKPL